MQSNRLILGSSVLALALCALPYGCAGKSMSSGDGNGDGNLISPGDNRPVGDGVTYGSFGGGPIGSTPDGSVSDGTLIRDGYPYQGDGTGYHGDGTGYHGDGYYDGEGWSYPCCDGQGEPQGDGESPGEGERSAEGEPQSDGSPDGWAQ